MKGNRQIRTAQAGLQRAEQLVTSIEDQLGLQDPWTPDSPEYKTVVANMVQRDYQRALDELEQLVVQRLFELTKLNMSGTGES